MKNFWLASLGVAALCTATAALAQTAAPATAPAPARPPAAAPVAAAPAPVAAAPAVAPAPVAAKPAAPAPGDWSSYSNPYSGEENDLQNANRSPDEIVDWTRQRATDALSFSPVNIDGKLAIAKTTFTAPGLAEYMKYLQESKLTDMVKTQGYAVTTIVNGDPMILNSGSMAGSYHWLVELPLMVTFLHTGEDGGQTAVAGGEFKLHVQLGRVPQKQGIDGMQIESWKMMDNKAPAPTP